MSFPRRQIKRTAYPLAAVQHPAEARLSAMTSGAQYGLQSRPFAIGDQPDDPGSSNIACFMQHTQLTGIAQVIRRLYDLHL